LSASFFVVSKRIGSPGFLTAEQTRELARAGMEIGSHGTRHRRWAELNASDLHEELSASRDELETVLGREVREAACPFGSYNRRVLRGLRSAGYSRVYTSDQGPARRNEWVSARNTIVRSHTLRYVQNIIESKPRGTAAFLRMLKLTVKRWR
jgi:peptidoglycan/xylan/chitin deacetylase (PgdA/CDA1 family)